MEVLILLAISSALHSVGSGAPAADLVTNLPGVHYQINFQQYSGYLKASSKHMFHYWVANNGNSLVENVYSWNKIANVLYIESPAGVGYSFSTDGNLNASDNMTATDNYHALIDFFTNKFPEFRSHDFYISGESYAGFYIPMLGKLIVQDPTNFPNFKGMAIGNGLLNYPGLVNSLIPMLYQHGLVSERQWQWLGSNCCNGNPGSCNYFYWFQHRPSACFSQIVQVYSVPSNHMDEYNLYATCYVPSSVQTDRRNHRGAFKNALFKLAGLDFEKDILRHSVKDEAASINVPLCAQTNNTHIYMNRPDVRAALHIPSNLGAWYWCSDIVNNIYQSQYFNMFQQFQAVMTANKRILVYNGDTDTACNAIGDQMFVSQLNATLLSSKRVWTYANDIPDTAGLATRYKGIDFLTVRGSGHFVPLDKPREALQMIANFIWNKPYSSATGIKLSPQLPTGGYCSQMVMPPGILGGPVLASALCGQGECMDTPNGAVCKCSPGYSGPLCTKYVGTTKTVQIQLCAAYKTAMTQAKGLRFGCPQTYTCVPYQYKCVTTLNCNYPIGYCLPWVHLGSMSPSMKRKLRVLEQRTANKAVVSHYARRHGTNNS